MTTTAAAATPATFTLTIGADDYVGEGETRLEAFAEAVEKAGPALRRVLRQKRHRERGWGAVRRSPKLARSERREQGGGPEALDGAGA